MKVVRRTKEPSLNQMAIMVANLKEATTRDCSIRIEKTSWDRLTFSLYLSSSKLDGISVKVAAINGTPIIMEAAPAQVTTYDSWEDLQQLYFVKMEDANG
jgi:hypothetical protein